MSFRRIAVFVVVLVAAIIVLVGLAVIIGFENTARERQEALDPFYTPPDPIPQELGTVIRTEPMDIEVPNGSAIRMLYVSERPSGERAVSGGMVFIPDAPPAKDKNGRSIVAYAHGTGGLGEACAPSRSNNPTNGMDGWLGLMMRQGWVVAATDYVGIGTPGPNQYLIAQAEVRDVVNSVRAVQNIAEAGAGNQYTTFGHSQGGHSAVWAGTLAEKYAPGINLLGVAAAAPALNLEPIAAAQWQSPIGWVIGADLIESYPTYYPGLPTESLLTQTGKEVRERLTDECVLPAGLEALVRDDLGQQFFSRSPASVESWRKALLEQTPKPLPDTMPMFMTQGTADKVVLPWPNAIIQDKWCKAGSDLTTLWLAGTNHQGAAEVSGPAVVEWLAQRFQGKPTNPNCDFPPPVAPKNPGTPG